MLMIITAYPVVQMNDDIVDMWTKMLSDIPIELAVKNLEQHIKTSKYPPTIADIRGGENSASPLSVDRLRRETEERFRLMDQWEQNACPRPLLKDGDTP